MTQPFPALPSTHRRGNGATATVPGDPAEPFTAVVRLAREHLACERAGIAVRGAAGTAVTLAASDPVVEAADELQERHADGPTVSPAWPDSQVAIADLRGHRLWSTWAAAVVELGIRRVLATQIVTSEGPTGSLTLYYTSPADFGGQELALARLLARCAGAELGHAHDVASLGAAIEGRTGIGQAQGMLMERFGISADEAFAVLRRQSQDTNTKLREVARSLVDTRSLEAYSTRRRSRPDPAS